MQPQERLARRWHTDSLLSAARFTHVKNKAKFYEQVNCITALIPNDRTWPRKTERYVAFLHTFPGRALSLSKCTFEDCAVVKGETTNFVVC